MWLEHAHNGVKYLWVGRGQLDFYTCQSVNLAVLLLTCHSGASFGHNGLEAKVIVMYPVIDLNLSQELVNHPFVNHPFLGGRFSLVGGVLRLSP